MDLTVLHEVTYGMYVVGVDDAGRPSGCVINTLCQITSENPIVSISMSKQNYTYEVIRRTRRFSISILSEDTARNAVAVLGFTSGRDTDKFKDVPYTSFHGLPVLASGICGKLSCDVIEMVDMQTHAVIFARLTDTAPGDCQNPMTYSYYHRVFKGKAPKNAPTYQAEAAPQQGQTPRYVCDICGYVYEGDLSKAPADFVCPVCHMDKSHFHLQ